MPLSQILLHCSSLLIVSILGVQRDRTEVIVDQAHISYQLYLVISRQRLYTMQIYIALASRMIVFVLVCSVLNAEYAGHGFLFVTIELFLVPINTINDQSIRIVMHLPKLKLIFTGC